MNIIETIDKVMATNPQSSDAFIAALERYDEAYTHDEEPFACGVDFERDDDYYAPDPHGEDT